MASNFFYHEKNLWFKIKNHLKDLKFVYLSFSVHWDYFWYVYEIRKWHFVVQWNEKKVRKLNEINQRNEWMQFIPHENKCMPKVCMYKDNSAFALHENFISQLFD